MPVLIWMGGFVSLISNILLSFCSRHEVSSILEEKMKIMEKIFFFVLGKIYQRMKEFTLFYLNEDISTFFLPEYQFVSIATP